MTKISLEFSKSKGHNSVKNYLTGTKIEPDLRILVSSLCTKFYLKMSMYVGYNEWNESVMREGLKGVTLHAPGHFMAGA